MGVVFQANWGECKPSKAFHGKNTSELPSDQKGVPVSTVIWTKDNSCLECKLGGTAIISSHGGRDFFVSRVN